MEFVVTFTVWMLFRIHQVSSAALPTEEVSALQLIYKEWQTTELNWTDYDPCGSHWRGVTCNQTGSQDSVVKLIANRGDINGTLSTAVGKLIHLTVLDLSFNRNLTGEIPSEIGGLTNLTHLGLQGCNFFGSVPASLGQLKMLKFLALNMNNLTGAIPPELGGLKSVTWFDLAQNNLIGPLPSSSTNPANIGLENLTNILHIHLFNNSFSGTLPKEYSKLPKLKHLMLENNQINGTIPPEYGDFPSLQILRIDNNKVEGSIPSTISRCQNLLELYVHNNILTGTVPDLSNLTKIALLNVGDNVFDPQSMSSVLTLTNLYTLGMNKANLNGSIPDSLLQLPKLESLSLATNRLTGTVDFQNATNRLKIVNLNDNNITDITGITNRFNLSLIGNPVCTDPRYHFSDQVCAPVINRTYNSQNQTCTIVCNGNLVMNPSFCTCAYPITVFYQFNAPSFSDITEDRIETFKIKLSNQTLVDKLQLWVPLAVWTVNHRLEVVVNIFPNKTDERMTYYNSEQVLNRIALHLDAQFPDEFGPYSVKGIRPPLIVGKKSSKLGSGVIAGIAVAAAVVFIGLASAITYALFQKRRADNAALTSLTSWGSMGRSGGVPKLKGARYFTLLELKKATNKFDSSNEIGSGGYGKVYKGVLATGETVAIKKAEEGSMQGSGEFKTEIELLSRVHHKNLVGLVGFCFEQGAQILVYEYMQGGSLRDRLSDGLSSLITWQKRLEIALDSAKGITYLHELANPPIIHRDIKSSNILLTQQLNAKVADFGLGKLGLNEDITHVSTQVKGTMGYMDPEYFMTQQLTEKSDVYSFGIVLLELLTARPPITAGRYIVREIRTALDRGGLPLVESLLDPHLNVDDIAQADLMKFLDLALSCVEENGAARPRMNQVVKELEVLVGEQSVPSVQSPLERGVYDDAALLSRSADPEFAYSGVFQSNVVPK